MHSLDGCNGVVTMLARSLETELTFQIAQKPLRHLLKHPHSPISLDVAVAAHRAKPRALAAYGTQQQMEVHHLLDRRHGVLVLSQSHGPAGDDFPPASGTGAGDLLHRLPGNTAHELQFRPV